MVAPSTAARLAPGTWEHARDCGRGSVDFEQRDPQARPDVRIVGERHPEAQQPGYLRMRMDTLRPAKRHAWRCVDGAPLGRCRGCRYDRHSARLVSLRCTSGLLGISETSSDMRHLLASETADVSAAEAVALFCYQVRQWFGAFAAVPGGFDTLVFAGGVGGSAPSIRQRICAGLGFLGIELEAQRNAHHASLISTDAGRVQIRVIHTDEEIVIAKSTARVLNLQRGNPKP